MGSWDPAWWSSTVTSGPRRDRRSGEYRTYQPDLLASTPLLLSPATDALVADAERRTRMLGADSPDLASVARFLLRSEAIASSRIEGISPSAKQIAFAELGQHEQVRGLSESAQLVANNMTVVREATTALQHADSVTTSDVEGCTARCCPTTRVITACAPCRAGSAARAGTRSMPTSCPHPRTPSRGSWTTSSPI